MTIKEFNNAIYFSLSNNYIQIENASRHFFFYDFIEKEFSYFLNLLKDLDENELKSIADNNSIFYELPFAKKRFVNLMKFITDRLLEILQYCYKGDLWYAGSLLQSLMGENNKKIQRYLIEPYIEYFEYKSVLSRKWYRMRDEYAERKVNDCWHLPYNLRHRVNAGRYSMQGFPCLYLADSLETANAELRELELNKIRWYSEFKLRKNHKELFLLDLSIPNLNIEMLDKEYLDLIITYPVRLLCSVKTLYEGNSFHEEYYIPQLMCQLLMASKMGKLSEYTHKGILFSSTANNGGLNCVLPALYKDNNPPTDGHSNILFNLFEASKPVIYKAF